MDKEEYVQLHKLLALMKFEMLKRENKEVADRIDDVIFNIPFNRPTSISDMCGLSNVAMGRKQMNER